MANGIDVAEQKNDATNKNNKSEQFIKHVSGKSASCFSKLTFHYLTKLIEKVKTNPLVMNDIPPTEEKYLVQELLKSFDEANMYKDKLTSTGLVKLLFHMNPRIFILTFFLAFYYMVAQLITPLMLRGIIISVGSNTEDGIYYAFGLYFCLVSGSLCNQHCQNFLYHVGNRQRATLSAIIFRAALSRSQASYSKDGVSIGAVVNLLSNDAQKLYDVMPTIHLLWSAPTQIIIATYLLINTLGSTSLVGVAFLCLMAPVNFFIAKSISKMREWHMPITDKRVELCSEIIEGIHSVKCFSWERKFYEKILQVRKGEVKYIRQELYAFANFICLLIAFPIVSLMLTFVTYVHTQHMPLSAANAFGTLALFNVLRFPLMELGQILSICTQAFIALQRIAKFIQQSSQAVGDFSINILDDIGESEDGTFIKIEANTTLMWTIGTKNSEGGQPSGDGFNLKVIDEFICKDNDLIAIVGQVGSGKSLFINSVLGETYCCNGSMYVQSGIKSLVPQTAWILNRSVRNNIIFDNEFDVNIYTQVLEACQLTVDIKSFSELDQTMIGERGVTLSGGQKQRVSLARASYSCLVGKSKVIIMDDPLSALDAHTAKNIFEALIGPQGILKNIPRILVTHATHFLPFCSQVFLAKDGTLIKIEHAQETLNDITIELAKAKEEGPVEEEGEDITLTSRSSNNSTTSAQSGDENNVEYMQQKKGKNLMTDENSKKGSLNISVVFRFVSLGGGRLWVSCLALFFLLERSSYGTCDWWLSVWSSAEKAPPKNDPGFGWPAATTTEISKWYSYMYMICVGVMIVLVFCRLNTFVMCICKAAEKTFEKLLYGVLRTNVNWFEVTPHGRITNRFNFDTEVIDSALFQRINGSVASTMWLLTGTVIMVSVSPYIFFILLPTVYLYLKLHKFYRTSCVELQRLDSATRSPIQASFFEALQGLDSIRAYHAEEKFTCRANLKIEESLAVVKVQTTANRWLGVRLEVGI
jgi:ATP-binding cassette, subfamily C (CFTR/MRP), member 1